MPAMTQQTVFDLCDYHAKMIEFAPRLLAGMFARGGPSYGGPCAPRLCRVHPAGDLFAAEVTEEMTQEWVRDWHVNRDSAIRSSHDDTTVRVNA